MRINRKRLLIEYSPKKRSWKNIEAEDNISGVELWVCKPTQDEFYTVLWRRLPTLKVCTRLHRESYSPQCPVIIKARYPVTCRPNFDQREFYSGVHAELVFRRPRVFDVQGHLVGSWNFARGCTCGCQGGDSSLVHKKARVRTWRKNVATT